MNHNWLSDLQLGRNVTVDRIQKMRPSILINFSCCWINTVVELVLRVHTKQFSSCPFFHTGARRQQQQQKKKQSLSHHCVVRGDPPDQIRRGIKARAKSFHTPLRSITISARFFRKSNLYGLDVPNNEWCSFFFNLFWKYFKSLLLRTLFSTPLRRNIHSSFYLLYILEYRMPKNIR